MKPVITILLLVLSLAAVRSGAQTLIGPTRSVTLTGVASASPDGGSFAPVISGNGQFVVFASYADNLVTNNGTGSLDIFVRDLNAGTTRLASATSSGSGGNGSSSYPVISSNGQFVAFLSMATNLVAGDANGLPDVYVRDMVAGVTTLESIGVSGGAGKGGYCLGFDLTPDGRFLAFSSSQTNLVTNSVSTYANIYLRDRQAGATELISVQAADGVSGGSGNSDFAVATPDGQKVVFYSSALDLVSWGTNTPPAAGQIYLRDRSALTTVCLGINAQPFIIGPMKSFNAALSADGSAVTFIAASTTNNQSALLYYNLTNGQSSLISGAVDVSSWPEMSANGHQVVYSVNSNIFVWDEQTGSNVLVSVDLNGSTNGVSLSPTISADGSRIAFVSSATNLTATASGGAYQVYVRDLASGTTRLASPNLSGGASGDAPLAQPALSADGGMVAFTSPDDSLTAGDLNKASDVFTWSWITGQAGLISRIDPSKPSVTSPGFLVSGSQAVSMDGRYVAYSALDDNALPGETNGLLDVYVRDMVTGQILSASGGLTNGPFTSPAISGDGRYVAFLRGSASGLQPGDIYLHDFQTGTLTLVSATANGAAIGTASAPVMSVDGRFIAFSTSTSLSPNDVTGFLDIYVYDVQQKTNRLISVKPNNSSDSYDCINPIFSPDGNWVAFQSKSPNLINPSLSSVSSYQIYARNLISNKTYFISFIPTNIAPTLTALPGDNTNAVFSGDSRYLAFRSFTNIYGNPVCLHDFVTGTNQLVCSNASFPSLNRDGSKIAWASTNGQVYVTTRSTLQSNLVSVATDRSSFGNGTSSIPLFSPDGRVIVFSSKASNLAANDTNLLTDIFVRDLVLSNTMVISVGRQGMATGDCQSVNPLFAADGRTIVFQSFGANLAANDFNGSRDLFIVRLGTGDSDGDGMDDDWEIAYFGDLSHDGTADTDGDGMTDLQEFLAGTNPTGNTSVLQCLGVASSQGITSVYWSAVPGRSYRVEYKDDLNAAAWTALVSQATATSGTGSVIDSSAGLTRHHFYRVALLP